jgi:thioredoxin reductase (NADPH)
VRRSKPENIEGKQVMVVGGGDSAIESAMLLADHNNVILSYRGDAFGRIKPNNQKRINALVAEKKVDVRFNTNVVSIEEHEVVLIAGENQGEPVRIKNDLLYIFAGGELPTQFLTKVGIKITKKFGEAILKHK